MCTRLILLLFTIIIFSKCEIDEPKKQMPYIPEDIIIDLDDDGIDDFEIIYSYAIFPHSPYSLHGLACEIQVLGKHSILVKENEPILFLENLDLINEILEIPLEWKIRDHIIACYHENSKKENPYNWEIWSNNIKDSYLIGLKINKDNMSTIGWIEISIDNDTGKTTLLNKGIL